MCRIYSNPKSSRGDTHKRIRHWDTRNREKSHWITNQKIKSWIPETDIEDEDEVAGPHTHWQKIKSWTYIRNRERGDWITYKIRSWASGTEKQVTGSYSHKKTKR
jgi:hypothetical protein